MPRASQPRLHSHLVRSRSPEFKASPATFHAEPPLTGDESRVAEVKDVPFPVPPALVDDMPPTTVITRVFHKDGKLIVRGTCADNGAVKRVTVNGQDAKATAANFAEWEIVLEGGPVKLDARAEDAAGNVEKTPAIVHVK